MISTNINISGSETVKRLLDSNPSPLVAPFVPIKQHVIIVESPVKSQRDDEELYEIEEVFQPKYIHSVSNFDSKILSSELDHIYAKSWKQNELSQTDNSIMSRPTRTIFMKKFIRNSIFTSKAANDDVVNVDVSSEPLDARLNISPICSKKATFLMNECKRFSGFARFADSVENSVNISDENWEQNICRNGWSVFQSHIFDKALNILHLDNLARLSLPSVTTRGNVDKTPIHTRLIADKTAKRFRLFFASGAIMWQPNITGWLHNALCHSLPDSYLVAYLDVLQFLHYKAPLLVDRMISHASSLTASSIAADSGEQNVMGCSLHRLRMNVVAKEGLEALIERPWEPTLGHLKDRKIRKLRVPPIFIVVPSRTTKKKTSRRKKFWLNVLSKLGSEVICLEQPPASEYMGSIAQYIRLVFNSTLAKLRQVKKQNIPVVLIGWALGGAICCEVAVVESTTVITLGFSTHTLRGLMNHTNDMLDIQTGSSILFVVGEFARRSSIEDIEDVRLKLRVKNGLVVVGGSDDLLRMYGSRKKEEVVTQYMVDMCILDEVHDFLVWSLNTTVPDSHQIMNEPVNDVLSKFKTNVVIPSTSKRSDEDTMAKKSASVVKLTGNIPAVASMASSFCPFTATKLSTHSCRLASSTSQVVSLAAQNEQQQPPVSRLATAPILFVTNNMSFQPPETEISNSSTVASITSPCVKGIVTVTSSETMCSRNIAFQPSLYNAKMSNYGLINRYTTLPKQLPSSFFPSKPLPLKMASDSLSWFSTAKNAANIKTEEKRDVAEILASLSHFVPLQPEEVGDMTPTLSIEPNRSRKQTFASTVSGSNDDELNLSFKEGLQVINDDTDYVPYYEKKRMKKEDN